MTTPLVRHKANIRLAIREEADGFIVAYFAEPNTMEGAIRIASVLRSVLETTPGAFGIWTGLCEQIIRAQVAAVLDLPAGEIELERETPPEQQA